MRAFSIIFAILLTLITRSESVEFGEGDSGSGFVIHSVKFSKSEKADYPYCGRLIHDVIPINLFNKWVRINFYVANDCDGVDAASIIPLITGIIFNKDSKTKFLKFDELKEKMINNSININARITIMYKRSKEHSNFGEKYIVINLDSKKRIAYLLHEDQVGVFTF